MKLLKIILSEANLSKEIKLFKEMPANNIFFRFVDFVKTEMNSNFLGKKVIAWFNENRLQNKKGNLVSDFEENKVIIILKDSHC